MMTMKEACEYKVQSRRKKAIEHREKVTKGDYCSGLTEKEYNKVKVKQKASFAKGKSAAFNSVWRHYNIPLPK